jgi:hypothetical protein
MYRLARSFALGVMFAAIGTTEAFGLVWQVPGDNSNTCTVGVRSCDTIAAAVAAASAGDSIEIGAGTFSGAGNFGVIVDKALAISGAGRAATTVSPDPGTAGFSVRADDVSIADLAIDGGAFGIRFDSTAADNAQIARVDLRNSTSRGIDIGTTQPVTNTAIDDCTFTSVTTGLRMASNSQVNGLSITDSTFTGNTYGIYQANDGNSSTLSNFLVADCTFTNQTQHAIYAEELRDATISDSVFSNNRVAFQLFKIYSGTGLAASNITIERNQFSGHTGTAINLEVYTLGLETGATIADNEIDIDVSTLAFNAAGIFVGLSHSLTHAPVTISGNTIRMQGNFGVANAAFGVRIRRNGPVTLTGNVLDGGDVGGSGDAPATSGVYIEARNTATAAMPATTTIDASCNRITGFRNGVSVYDSFNLAYGGLAAGATVTYADNAIAGNSDFGMRGGAPSETIVATDNFWGCPDGPGGVGCDVVDGNVDDDPAAIEAAACVGCAEDTDCSDPCLALAQCIDAACSGTPIPGCGDHYISYQAKAQKKDLAKQPIPGNELEKNFVLTVNDVHLDDADADDPENFVLGKPRNLLVPARPDSEPAPLWPEVAYVRFTSRSGKESVAPVLPSGKYPKPAKHLARTFLLENGLGTIEVASKKVSAMLVPAGASTVAPDPAAPAGATQYQCYAVKATDAVTGQTPDAGGGVGKLRKDMQAFLAETLFDECATTYDGGIGFENTPVEGMCLFDVRKPAELCNPVDTENVEPNRTTTAAIDPSTAATAQSLLCYRIKPAKKVLAADVATILGLQVGDKLAKPKKVPKRGIKTGDALLVSPGNAFPAPSLLDTKGQQSVCIPTTVLSVD